MMRSLWVQLSLAFAAVVMLGFIIIVSIIVASTNEDVARYFVQSQYQVPNGLIDQLEQSYRENNGWSDIDNLLTPYDNALLYVSANYGFRLIFADESATVIFDQLAIYPENILTINDQREAVSVEINSMIRGYLLITRTTVGNIPDNLRPRMQEQLQRILLALGAVASIISLVFGILFSRTLTAPLHKLSRAASEFSKGNFDQRVAIQGSTEIQAVATAFNEMAQALSEAEMLRRNLVADVAHELRTPLSVLQANLQAMQDGVYSRSDKEIDALMQQTNLLKRLVNDLHQLAQADAHQLVIHAIPLDLRSCIMEAVEQFSTLSEQQAIHLSYTSTADSVWINGDRLRISQILHNLLQNAFTHTPSGGQITVGLSISDMQKATISVSDTGTGISPDHLPYIFERFYRADSSRSRSQGGTGLGLAIVKALVEAHDGEIRVESSNRDGTTFFLEFPLENDLQQSKVD
jgi:signal transduction histidine kinase